MKVAVLDRSILEQIFSLYRAWSLDTVTATNAIYSARAGKDVAKMWAMKDGPMGPSGGAAIVIAETLLGKENTSQTAAISIAFMTFSGNLTSVLQGDPVRPAFSPDVLVPHINPAQTSENARYETALGELESGTKDRGTWAKAFAESADDDSAQRLYIKLRVEQLSQADKKPEVVSKPPQQAVRAAMHTRTPVRQNTTPKSAPSDASAKSADETKPKTSASQSSAKPTQLTSSSEQEVFFSSNFGWVPALVAAGVASLMVHDLEGYHRGSAASHAGEYLGAMLVPVAIGLIVAGVRNAMGKSTHTFRTMLFQSTFWTAIGFAVLIGLNYI